VYRIITEGFHITFTYVIFYLHEEVLKVKYKLCNTIANKHKDQMETKHISFLQMWFVLQISVLSTVTQWFFLIMMVTWKLLFH